MCLCAWSWGGTLLSYHTPHQQSQRMLPPPTLAPPPLFRHRLRGGNPLLYVPVRPVPHGRGHGALQLTHGREERARVAQAAPGVPVA